MFQVNPFSETRGLKMRHFSKSAVLVVVLMFALAEQAAAQGQLSQPTFSNSYDQARFKSLVGDTFGYALQNGPETFDYVPMEVKTAKLYDEFQNSVVSRWALGWNKSDWAGYLDRLEGVGFGPPSGVDQQPIDPDAATGTYQDPDTGNTGWNQRVKASEKAKRSAGLLTCKAAIAALHERVCQDTKKCDLEEEYKSSCVTKHSNVDDAKSCVAVVSDYETACYSGPGLKDFNYTSLSGGGTSERPLCNVASFSHVGQIAFATAGHCVKDHELTSGFHRKYAVEQKFTKTDDGPFHPSGDFSFLESDDALAFLQGDAYPLSTGQAREFEPTIFAGNNSLALLANEVSKLNELPEEFGLYWIDSSALCTVVQYDGGTGEMLHTCQTTRGASGGILVQKHEDAVVVVGVNTGPSDEDHNTTNMAQFASGSAFQN